MRLTLIIVRVLNPVLVPEEHILQKGNKRVQGVKWIQEASQRIDVMLHSTRGLLKGKVDQLGVSHFRAGSSSCLGEVESGRQSAYNSLFDWIEQNN